MNGIITFDGAMNWPGALFWIDSMNTASYLGASDWRLPSTLVPDPSCTNFDGTPRTDSQGYDCAGSELGHLFYTEFNATRDTSVMSTGDSAALARFTNIQSKDYWSGTESGSNPDLAWDFDFSQGTQSAIHKVNDLSIAWAVHPGNISFVPIPASAWLFGSALGMLGWVRRIQR